MRFFNDLASPCGCDESPLQTTHFLPLLCSMVKHSGGGGRQKISSGAERQRSGAEKSWPERSGGHAAQLKRL